MHLLTHLHGTVALIVLCALLFVDETGVPLPLAPNEVLLIVGGMLTQTHALHASVFFPAAALAMGGGMLTGYTAARKVGQAGLLRLARRVGAGDVAEQMQRRLQGLRAPHIAVARLIPGVRPWATVIAGASHVPIQTFLLGAVPALLLWEITWVALGVLVGVPAEHYFGLFEHLLVRGIVLCILGVLAYGAIRQLRSRSLLTEAHVAVLRPLVLVVAGVATASLTAGTLAVLRDLLQIHHHGWVDALVVLAVMTASAAVALVRRRPHRQPASAAALGS